MQFPIGLFVLKVVLNEIWYLFYFYLLLLLECFLTATRVPFYDSAHKVLIIQIL